MDSNKFRSTDRQLTATLGESSISLKKQTRDLTTDGHVNMGHGAQLQLTNNVQSNDSVKLPQTQISGIPEEDDIDPTTIQNNSKLQVTDEERNRDIEPPDGPQMQITDVSTDGHVDSTDKHDPQLVPQKQHVDVSKWALTNTEQ